MKFLCNLHKMKEIKAVLILYCLIIVARIVSADNDNERPNIVLFISDDQDIELGSMEYMRKTLDVFRKGGAEFLHAFVSTPICCPSRTSILTGSYVHNHHVHSNNENCTGTFWRNVLEPRTFAVRLRESGYKTGYFGKYLNEYNGSYVPPGYDEWAGLVKNSRFYNYTMNYNGRRIRHGHVYKLDYLTDLIVNDSLAFFKRERSNPDGPIGNVRRQGDVIDGGETVTSSRESMTSSRETSNDVTKSPILMILSFPAPHGPEDPAPQYSQLFENVTSHRTTSWNYAPNPDKQWILQHTGKMEPVHVAFTDFLQRRRLQTLQSVDDAVHRVYTELKNLGELNNTYLLYTSDHGYHLGQFGLIKGKSMPYDFDLRVPYFIRGPETFAGTKIKNLVLNIDLAPTILDMAGLAVPEDEMDGRSILPLLKNEWEKFYGRKPKKLYWRHTALIEKGLRPKLIKLRERLMKQNEHYSKDLRVQKECERQEYQAPCKPGQYWECRKSEIGRWRIFKCRGDVSINKKDCQCANKKKRFRYRIKRRGKRMTANRTTAAFEFSDPESGLNRKNPVESGYGYEKTESGFESFESGSDRRVTVSEFETGKYGRTAFVTEEQLDEWADEFFEFVSQKEIVDSQWYQGRFDAVENINDTSHEFDDDDEDEEMDEVVRRSKRKVRKHHKRHNGIRSRLKDKPRACELNVQNNETVKCRTHRYTNFRHWRQDMDTVETKIQNLRHRLHEMINVRRHLKEERPWLDDGHVISPVLTTDPDTHDSQSPSSSTLHQPQSTTATTLHQEKLCKCDGQHEFHPLKYSSNLNEISDQELLALAEERQKLRLKNLHINHSSGADFTPNDNVGGRKKKRKRFWKKGGGAKNDESSSPSLYTSPKKQYCNVPNLNCFTHDNQHWRTPPYWTLGPFCFCQNSNNNSYWCLRTVNSTHNFLYCEFVTGFVSFYDMTKDRHQLHNMVYTLSYPVLEQLSLQLERLRSCKGSAQCSRHERTKHRKFA